MFIQLFFVILSRAKNSRISLTFLAAEVNPSRFFDSFLTWRAVLQSYNKAINITNTITTNNNNKTI